MSYRYLKYVVLLLAILLGVYFIGASFQDALNKKLGKCLRSEKTLAQINEELAQLRKTTISEENTNYCQLKEINLEKTNSCAEEIKSENFLSRIFYTLFNKDFEKLRQDSEISYRSECASAGN